VYSFLSETKSVSDVTFGKLLCEVKGVAGLISDVAFRTLIYGG
jgi:hypothetical protein